MFCRIRLLLVMVLLSSVILGGCAPDGAKLTSETGKPAATNQAEQKEGTGLQSNHPQGTAADMQLTVYFASTDAMYVVPQVYTVAKNEQPLKSAIELLLAGPKNQGVLAVFPKEVKLKSVMVKDHIAYVDFNDKLLKNKVGGSAGEMLLVGALVDTVTEFPDVKKVQILVEGKKIETISGHMDTGEPIGRMEHMIKR